MTDNSSRIIVGVDGTPGSVAALRWAQRWAADLGRPLEAHYVMSDTVAASVREGVPAASAVEAAGEAVVREALESAGLADGGPDAAGSIEITVSTGPASEELCERAATGFALVLGWRSLGPVSASIAGSVTARCAARATVPVVVVPVAGTLPEGPFRTMVGVDDSASAVAAVRFGRSVTPEDRPLTVVHFWNRQAAATPEPMVSVADDVRSDEDAARLVDRVVERALGERCAGVVRLARHGDPRQRLTELTGEVDLLVLGQRGGTAASRLLFGSVAAHIVHHLELPTAFVPAEPVS